MWYNNKLVTCCHHHGSQRIRKMISMEARKLHKRVRTLKTEKKHAKLVGETRFLSEEEVRKSFSWIPDGWRVEIRITGQGDKMRSDTYYHHTTSGKRLRSRVTVERWVEETGGKTC